MTTEQRDNYSTITILPPDRKPLGIRFRNNVIQFWEDNTSFKLGEFNNVPLSVSLKIIRRALDLQTPIIVATDRIN